MLALLACAKYVPLVATIALQGRGGTIRQHKDSIAPFPVSLGRETMDLY